MTFSLLAADFVKYLAEHPNIRPTKAFDAMAAEAEKLPWPYTWPKGNVLIYPEYLVFLTTRHYKTGVMAFGEAMLAGMREQFKLYEWVTDPTSLITDLTGKLIDKYKDPAALSAALGNPNSFFVRLDEVRDVTSGGGYAKGDFFKPPYIRIATTTSCFILHMSADFSPWNLVNIKRSLSTITSHWEDEALAQLQQRAKQNAVPLGSASPTRVAQIADATLPTPTPAPSSAALPAPTPAANVPIPPMSAPVRHAPLASSQSQGYASSAMHADICPRCGQQNVPNVTYCARCGQMLRPQ
ncbi:MAG: hypothetical protein OJF49_004572 [Ktedonobacterales bacterium]|nr:MAG: hypothetical protein OJF49_004572 [Ktedonobacterales bacterium]